LLHPCFEILGAAITCVAFVWLGLPMTLGSGGLVATGHQNLALVIVTINAVLMYLWGQ
jgi:hypothetical protein